MIRLITGVPRSGKSFLAVKEIFDLLEAEQPINPNTGKPFKIHIVTNIEGLKIDDARLTHMEFDKSFFQNTKFAPFLRDLRDKHGLDAEDTIYVYIDEAQRYFAKPDEDTVYFFDYHGHYGVNVIIITQHEKKIAFSISCHHEFEHRAAAASTNPFSGFVYKQLQAGERFGTVRLKRDPRIFKLYKSFQAGTGKPVKSKLRYFVGFGVVAAVLMWFLFFKVFARSFGLGGDSPARVELGQTSALAAPLAKKSDPAAPVKNQASPSPVPADPAAPVIPDYQGPEIIEYSQSRDALKISVNGLDAWVPVVQFLSDNSPSVYGYGYFHAPHKKFLLMDRPGGKILFPVNGTVYVRSYIKSEPVEPVVFDTSVPYGHQFSGPGLTDRDGYTETDREHMKWADLTLQGFSVDKPKEKTNVEQFQPVAVTQNSTNLFKP